jgi:hypothetical protein
MTPRDDSARAIELLARVMPLADGISHVKIVSNSEDRKPKTRQGHR